MEILLYFFLVLVLNSILPVWLPWWILLLINLMAVFPFRLGKLSAFFVGGTSAGLSWLTYSLWVSHQNEHILAPRLTKVLSLPHPVLLFLIVFLIPFLLGGLASVTGVSFKKFVQTNAY